MFDKLSAKTNTRALWVPAITASTAPRSAPRSQRLPHHRPLALTPKPPSRDCQAMASSVLAPASPTGSDSAVTYDATLFVRDAASIPEGSHLWLSFIAEDASSRLSGRVNITSFKSTPYQKNNPSKSGTNFTGNVSLPADFTPGAAILHLESQDADRLPKPLYLRKLTLKGHRDYEFLANSYIDHSHNERFIFPSKSYLPAKTLPGLQKARQHDLEAHQGFGDALEKLRRGADRIYAFDTYNDLGKPLLEKARPTLGGSPSMPFPRRVRTGRGMDKNGFETRIPDPEGKLPWVPLDERFTLEKERTFEGLNKYSAGAVASSPQGFVKAVMGLKTLQKNLATSEFPNLAAIDAMYDDLEETEAQGTDATMISAMNKTDTLHSISHWLHEIGHELSDSGQKLVEKVLKLASHPEKGAPAPDPADLEGSLPPEELKVLSVVQFLSGITHRWPVPNVRKGRKNIWHTDEEFGRQVMEGQNPLVVRAMTKQDVDNFAVSDADVEGLLEGASLTERVAEGSRMFVLDFHTHFKDFVKRVNALPGPNNKQRVLYAGRCVLYSRNDKVLVPVAIELETEGVPLTVYTPHNSPELWRLAKSVIASLETWHHQAIVHLLQTHLCVEPYITATRRYLSTMHPVNKLLQPAFRWTMRPNADARQNLISADGIIETAFTIGSWSMPLVSQIYGAEWKFNEQSLTDDLIARGVAKQGSKGLVFLLPGYSYAEDGYLIYAAIEKWVAGYVALYYNDKEEDKKVTNDPELVRWWHGIRTEGHPEKDDGWVELKDTAALTKILSTILWTTGPHHAAVNYGQYQYSGYMPNRPSMIRKKIPLPGTTEEKELAEDFEKKLLEVISDPLSTATLMLMTKLLSHHSADEEFINSPEHSWIRDPPALDLYANFVDELNNAEAEINRRNKSEARLRGGRGLPYTQLMPSVDPSDLPEEANGDIGYQVTYRGIPNSIAI